MSSLDAALILDTTGELGTHLQALRRRLPDLLPALSRLAPRTRLGVIAFKDHGCEGQDEHYLVRRLALQHDRSRLLEFLGDPGLAPGAGGGGAEALECALRAARSLRWRATARRVVVVVSDKPPHGAGLDGLERCPEGVDWREQVQALARDGVAIVAIQVGDQLETARVFEWMALETGGAHLRSGHPRELARTVVRALVEAAGALLLPAA